jgi:hypothetical protein
LARALTRGLAAAAGRRRARCVPPVAAGGLQATSRRVAEPSCKGPLPGQRKDSRRRPAGGERLDAPADYTRALSHGRRRRGEARGADAPCARERERDGETERGRERERERESRAAIAASRRHSAVARCRLSVSACQRIQSLESDNRCTRCAACVRAVRLCVTKNRCGCRKLPGTAGQA